MEAAKGLSVTMHRAFDVAKDPMEVLEQAIDLGVNTILTSGCEDTCMQGKDCIRELVERAKRQDRYSGGRRSECCGDPRASALYGSGILSYVREGDTGQPYEIQNRSGSYGAAVPE